MLAHKYPVPHKPLVQKHSCKSSHSVSLCLAISTARIVATFVNNDTTSHDTRILSCSTSRKSLMELTKSFELSTRKSLLPTSGVKTWKIALDKAYVGEPINDNNSNYDHGLI